MSKHVQDYRCDACKHWVQETFYTYDEVIDTGQCYGLPSGKITIEVKAGWDGGFVSRVETDADFFCFEFSPK